MDDAFELDINAAGFAFSTVVELLFNICSRRVSACLKLIEQARVCWESVEDRAGVLISAHLFSYAGAISIRY